MICITCVHPLAPYPCKLYTACEPRLSSECSACLHQTVTSRTSRLTHPVCLQYLGADKKNVRNHQNKPFKLNVLNCIFVIYRCEWARIRRVLIKAAHKTKSANTRVRRVRIRPIYTHLNVFN